MRRLAVACLIAALSVPVVAGQPAFADDATETARRHYETGLDLFYAREHAQALIEFQRAHEVKPRPATVFMMAQCEYLLGALKKARDHYQAYLRESPTGEFVEVAKDRIESINRRPATLVINTVPDQVDVRITADTLPPIPATAPAGTDATTGAAVATVVTGQAPNEFTVPRGSWLITVSKPNYLTQHMTVEVDVAETKPLFFKLDPIPARLEIETSPAGASLWVNDNFVKNPYGQDVPPGRFEIFATAPDHKNSTTKFVLGPGDRRLLVGPNAFRLEYVQRSGRPELLFASAVMGGLIGAGAVAGAVAAAEEKPGVIPGTVSSVSFTLGGALAGVVGGFLVANSFVPSYIPDNRALFVIGGMWVGVAEGALTGVVVRQASVSEVPATATVPAYYPKPTPSSQLKAAFIGSIPGIVLGTTVGSLLTYRAPTYGRVALIQSAAAGGAILGGLTAVAMQWNLRDWQSLDESTMTLQKPGASILDLSLPALVGLNAGLVGGLLGAYLPNQSRYGPSWQRIALIDLAGGAGALIGGIGACIADTNCLTANDKEPARAHAAGLAVLGAGAGVLAGILLTRNVDESDATPAPTGTPPPTLSLLPARNSGGGLTPMLTALGYF